MLSTSTLKLLAKLQGLFWVTRQMGEVDNEVLHTDKGNTLQIYHRSLHKHFWEVLCVPLPKAVEQISCGCIVQKQTIPLCPRYRTSHKPFHRAEMATLIIRHVFCTTWRLFFEKSGSGQIGENCRNERGIPQ